MRIKIIGECDSAKAVRGYLRMAGVYVTDFLPPQASAFTIAFEEGPQPTVICDSIPCDLETHVLGILHEFLSKLPDKPDVQLRRAGGRIRSDRELLLIVPASDPYQQDAAERAAYLGLLRTIGWGKPAAPEPRVEPPVKRPWWKKFLPLFLLFSMALPTIAQKAAGVLKPSSEAPQAARDSAPLTAIPLDDAAKVTILKLLREQDAAIIQHRENELRNDALDKQIQKLQGDINAAAQEIAVRNKIDLNELVLDLDKLAWTPKGLPK